VAKVKKEFFHEVGMTNKHSIGIDFEDSSYISQQQYTNEKEIEVSINPRESAEIHNKY